MFKSACFAIFCLAILICAQSCSGTKDGNQLSVEEVGRYLTAIVPDVIQPDDPVRFRFVVPGDTTKTEKLLSFSPDVDGTYEWEDAYTLKFSPEKNWTPGKEYKAIVVLSEIYKDVDPKLKRISFPFVVQAARLTVMFEPLHPEFMGDDPTYTLRGVVQSSVTIDSATASTILSCDNANLKWLPGNGQKYFEFVLTDLKPGEVVNFKWDGRSIGADESGKRIISAPPLDPLSVMDVKSAVDGEKKVSIYFSYKLNPQQDLTGLISLNGSREGFTWQRNGHVLDIYPSDEFKGDITIQLDATISSSFGKPLSDPVDLEVSLDDELPRLRLVGSGVITPGQTEFLVPFEAMNLKSVKVEVVRLFENNILPFLQNNNLQEPEGMDMLSHVIFSKQIDLSGIRNDDNRFTWVKYGLDIAPLVKLAPGSLYQVRIGFGGEDTYLDCYNDHEYTKPRAAYGEMASFWKYAYGYDDFDWEQYEDPCFPAYYNPSRFISRNVLASDIGMIAKQNETGEVWVYTSSILSAKPISNVSIEVIDRVHQTMTTIKTDGSGYAKAKVPRNAAFLIASHGDQKGYLKLSDGLSLSLSEFDAGGTSYQDGLRGFLFGERDVWRPGDSVFLQFILWDPESRIDARHPVQLTVTNPLGQKRIQQSSTHSIGGIYSLSFATNPGDITGNYIAKVRVGDATFTKSLKIETIKPNRLKIELPVPEQIQASQNTKLSMESDWLYGAPAANLKTVVEAQFSSQPFRPKGFSDFEFDDPTRKTPNTVFTVYEGTLNAEGKANFEVPDLSTYLPGGQMKMALKTRVFEQGGDFSTDQTSTIFHPYATYAGVSVGNNRWGYPELLLNKKNNVRIATVDPTGKASGRRKVTIGLYSARWSWWWDQTSEEITQFNSKLHLGAYETDTLVTGADGMVTYPITPARYGAYLIRVCDDASGHCAGSFYYAGSWGDPTQPNDAANRLSFGADKTEYNVGENVKLKIPSSAGSKLLLTIEKNNQVVSSKWYDATGDQTELSFASTADMMPNVYASVTLIQPHLNRSNDMPLRMYGTVPITVKDLKTELHPVIDMNKELEPGKKFSITVSEEDKKAMAYTIAIVDEGLLGLTRYQTPDPWAHFHNKEALSVQTYDMYDLVAGGYGATLERLLSIGGDDGVKIGDVPEAQRFKPVVLYKGPLYLEPGQKQTHDFQMPAYVGAVRVMVIASNRNQWGSSDKSVLVKSDLMVQPTLPRVVSPGETINVPVHVINTSAAIKNASVSITTNELGKVIGASTKSIAFDAPGDKMTSFALEIPKRLGKLKVKVSAGSGSVRAEQEIELDVRLPMPPKTVVQTQVLSGGQNWSSPIVPPGIEGTNSYSVEVSLFPSVNLEDRMGYLVRYPYGCLEQTTSAVFPQLYLADLVSLSDKEQKEIRENVTAGIKAMQHFLLPSGGFTYWPGESRADPWLNSYAGHVLIEASRKGYPVDKEMLNKWRTLQKADAQTYRANSYMRNDLIQAYRLYTLALDGQPLWSAMNRMKAQKQIETSAGWMLAAAYAIAKRQDVAEEILKTLPTKMITYAESWGTYGSDLRDEAILLQAYIAMNKNAEALTLAKAISTKLGSGNWYNTQALGWSLASMGQMATLYSGKEIYASLQVNGKTEEIKTTKSIATRQINEGAKDLVLKNNSSEALFVTLTSTGRPIAFDKTATQSNMNMTVRYLDLNGKPMQVSKLSQGTDFVAQVEVKYDGKMGNPVENMALSYFFPSGWEITNERLDAFSSRFTNGQVRYTNYRDDKVYVFFNMHSGTWVYNFYLTAAYTGKYLLPDVVCESMYLHNVRSRVPGQWVEVIASK